MPLLKNNQFIDDSWLRLSDDEAIPQSGGIIVSFARLLREFEKLSSRDDQLGVEFTNAESVSVLETFLPKLSLIALSFPKFGDGRAYSQARHLRQLGFKGELRAKGDVLPDQLAFMIEVGFTAFEVPSRFDPQLWQKTVSQIELSYQANPDAQNTRQTIWHARHAKPRRHQSIRIQNALPL